MIIPFIFVDGTYAIEINGNKLEIDHNYFAWPGNSGNPFRNYSPTYTLTGLKIHHNIIEIIQSQLIGVESNFEDMLIYNNTLHFEYGGNLFNLDQKDQEHAYSNLKVYKEPIIN